MIYIREAHAADSDWPEPLAVEQRINAPKTYGERSKIAGKCVTKLGLDIPFLIDDMNDTVNTLYDGHPDRLFLVDVDGTIAIRADRGPWGFKPGVSSLTQWLGERFP